MSDEELSYARRDAFILANEAKELRTEVAELKHDLFAAQFLAELWHVEAIAVKREGCQIKGQLDKSVSVELYDAARFAIGKKRDAAQAQVAALVEAVSAAQECGCHAAACPQFRYTAEEQAEIEREAATETP